MPAVFHEVTVHVWRNNKPWNQRGQTGRWSKGVDVGCSQIAALSCSNNLDLHFVQIIRKCRELANRHDPNELNENSAACCFYEGLVRTLEALKSVVLPQDVQVRIFCGYPLTFKTRPGCENAVGFFKSKVCVKSVWFKDLLLLLWWALDSCCQFTPKTVVAGKILVTQNFVSLSNNRQINWGRGKRFLFSLKNRYSSSPCDDVKFWFDHNCWKSY